MNRDVWVILACFLLGMSAAGFIGAKLQAERQWLQSPMLMRAD